MEKPVIGKRAYRKWIFSVLAVLLLAAVFIIWQCKKQETRAVDTDVEYSFNYIYPIKSSSVYYSDLYVDIEPVSLENLEAVCEVLSLAFTDTLEKIPEVHESFIGVTIWIRYREPEWPEEKTCVIREVNDKTMLYVVRVLLSCLYE